jgi:outer membrane protein assembly factor BamD (BamD/ComL family)
MNSSGMNLKKLCWIGLTLFTAACASRSASEQNLSADALLERGLTAMQNRKWSDAATALERFIFQFPTHPRAQEARFNLGEAHLGRREYLTAVTEFNRLASEFPASPWADDARFKVCETYSKLSPKAPLDQEYTFAGIAHCQSRRRLPRRALCCACTRPIPSLATRKRQPPPGTGCSRTIRPVIPQSS